MDRDDFIITVYCLVCEHYHALQGASSLRRGGNAVTPLLDNPISEAMKLLVFVRSVPAARRVGAPWG